MDMWFRAWNSLGGFVDANEDVFRVKMDGDSLL